MRAIIPTWYSPSIAASHRTAVRVRDPAKPGYRYPSWPSLRGPRLARDIPLQLLDVLALLLDDGFDQVADREYSHHAAILHDRQMPKSPLGHDFHAVVHRILRRHADGRRTHDVAHGCVVR